MSNIAGKCLSMCPAAEIEMRQREKLLHPLEILEGTNYSRSPKADLEKIVKKYSRSAAGLNLCDPETLRPTHILLKTIRYLLEEVSKDTRFSDLCIYNFINDRLRAINQDMVVQCLDPRDCVKILEPIINFHVIYGYKLCELPAREYDPYLNNYALSEYLKALLFYYDEIDRDVVKLLDSLNFTNEPNVFANRSTFEAIYVLHNLGDGSALTRFLNLPPTYRIQLAYDVSISCHNRNWIRLTRLMQNLPIVESCVTSLHLPTIRRQALEVMNHAYSSRSLEMEVVRDHLLYNNVSEVISDCTFHNVETSENLIQFNKKNQLKKIENNKKSVTLALKRLNHLDKRLKTLELSDLCL